MFIALPLGHAHNFHIDAAWDATSAALEYETRRPIVFQGLVEPSLLHLPQVVAQQPVLDLRIGGQRGAEAAGGGEAE